MRSFLKKFIEIIFPNQCLSCKELIGQEGAFCIRCWNKLQFISDPKCKICSHPFAFKVDDEMLCGKCLKDKPAYDKIISVFRYNDVIKRIIGDFKYRDATYLSKKTAKIIFDRYRKEIDKCDLITPVPLHKNRLRKRKFNQAVLLAKEISRLSGKELLYNGVIRIKNTQPQVELKKRQREKNLKAAFAINNKFKDEIVEKRVFLIDDVMTTGATLENCSKVLKKSGAKMVVALVIAKTVFL